MDPDEFTAIVKTVLADLEPPRLNDAEMAVFLEETTARLAAAAHRVDPRWLAVTLRGWHWRWQPSTD